MFSQGKAVMGYDAVCYQTKGIVLLQDFASREMHVAADVQCQTRTDAVFLYRAKTSSRHPLIVVSLCLILCVFSLPAPAASRIEFTGLTGERRENVQSFLNEIPAAEINTSARFKNKVSRDIKQALRALGYYQVIVDFKHHMDGDDLVLTALITANKFVRVHVADIRIYGEAAEDADFSKLIAKKAPKQGGRMHHGQYEAFKTELLNLANRKGYFDAEIKVSRLEVLPGSRNGTMRLHFYSGQRYRFGQTDISGHQIAKDRMLSLQPFKAGDPYQAELLGEFNQELAATGWFGAVDVNVGLEKRQQGQLPVEVQVTPAIQNTLETGVGYSTDSGGRFKANYEKPWLNNRGHSLTAKLELSQIEQSVQSGYKMPLRNVKDDFYLFSLGSKRRDYLDTLSRQYNLTAERQWKLSNQWYRTLSLRWLYVDYTQAEQQDTSNSIIPGVSFSKMEDSGGSMPSQAYRYYASVEATDPVLGSDSDFVRLFGRYGRIGSIGEDHRYLIRLHAGAILQEQVSSLPPELRFFAGGDNSLRGYAFDVISPKAQDGSLTGGKYMAVLNLEYQYRVKGDWRAAIFYDIGDAWDQQFNAKRGIGIGVRWASPIGAIRLDIAHGADAAPRNEYRIHFTIGPEL